MRYPAKEDSKYELKAGQNILLCMAGSRILKARNGGLDMVGTEICPGDSVLSIRDHLKSHVSSSSGPNFTNFFPHAIGDPLEVS